MKQDVEPIREFQSEISEDKLWKYYEVRACLLKYSEDDKEWKIGFLFVRLIKDKIPVSQFLPKLKRLRMIHEILSIDNLKDLLYSLSNRKIVRVGGVDASLELITTSIKYELYWNSHPYTAHFGIRDPCYGLSASGDFSSKLNETLESVHAELPSLSTPFQDLRDACKALFNLGFGTPAYSHFIVIFAPILVSINNVGFNRKRVEISVRISPEIDLHKIKLNLYGNNDFGEQTRKLGSAGDSFNDVLTEVLKQSLQTGPSRAINSEDQSAATDTTTLERDYTRYE